MADGPSGGFGARGSDVSSPSFPAPPGPSPSPSPSSSAAAASHRGIPAGSGSCVRRSARGGAGRGGGERAGAGRGGGAAERHGKQPAPGTGGERGTEGPQPRLLRGEWGGVGCSSGEGGTVTIQLLSPLITRPPRGPGPRPLRRASPRTPHPRQGAGPGLGGRSRARRRGGVG